eukprot:TRINITY_DN38691_c0_g2_i5.p2 TRINITY_DN38691_c0_g2~~TRINITY_DN38691_c0_g2_i5.p2  ORF type:complete len:161 (-),score=18.73 TRINITY_DN38691_c0_g2_i5:154-636(-)
MWNQKQIKQSQCNSFGWMLAVWLLLIRLNQCQQEDGNQGSYQNNYDNNQQQQQHTPTQELLEMWRGDEEFYQNSSVHGPVVIEGLSNLSSTWGEQQKNSQGYENDVVNNFPVPEINVVVESPPYSQNYNNYDQNQNQDQNFPVLTIELKKSNSDLLSSGE